jgi:DNA-directed RNA polymerase sigma subunit (sigma70/sigma32)
MRLPDSCKVKRADGSYRNIYSHGPEQKKKAAEERRAFILKAYESGMTLAEIGNQLDITRERVRQIVKKAQRLLRTAAGQ